MEGLLSTGPTPSSFFVIIAVIWTLQEVERSPVCVFILIWLFLVQNSSLGEVMQGQGKEKRWGQEQEEQDRTGRSNRDRTWWEMVIKTRQDFQWLSAVMLPGYVQYHSSRTRRTITWKNITYMKMKPIDLTISGCTRIQMMMFHTTWLYCLSFCILWRAEYT